MSRRYEEEDRKDLESITIKTKESTITITPNTVPVEDKTQQGEDKTQQGEDKEFLDKGETMDVRITHGNNFVLIIQYKKKYKGKEKWVTVIN